MKSVGQVIGPRFVPVRDEPVADLMTEKGEIAASRLTMSWKDALSDPGPDDLFVGMPQVFARPGRVHRIKRTGIGRLTAAGRARSVDSRS
jgi:hypothetical protein